MKKWLFKKLGLVLCELCGVAFQEPKPWAINSKPNRAFLEGKYCDHCVDRAYEIERLQAKRKDAFEWAKKHQDELVEFVAEARKKEYDEIAKQAQESAANQKNMAEALRGMAAQQGGWPLGGLQQYPK